MCCLTREGRSLWRQGERELADFRIEPIEGEEKRGNKEIGEEILQGKNIFLFLTYFLILF